jgi:hypothetical protein
LFLPPNRSLPLNMFLAIKELPFAQVPMLRLPSRWMLTCAYVDSISVLAAPCSDLSVVLLQMKTRSSSSRRHL